MDTCLYNILLGVLVRLKAAKLVAVGFALNEARETMVIPSLACCLS